MFSPLIVSPRSPLERSHKHMKVFEQLVVLLLGSARLNILGCAPRWGARTREDLSILWHFVRASSSSLANSDVGKLQSSSLGETCASSLLEKLVGSPSVLRRMHRIGRLSWWRPSRRRICIFLPRTFMKFSTNFPCHHDLR